MNSDIKLNENDVFRILCDIIASTLTRIRGNIDDLPLISDWTHQTSIKKNGFEVDSLELMTVAGLVNKMFHLYETGIEELLLRKSHIGEWTEIVMKSLMKHHESITFSTSGSTGKEKEITHAWNELLQEVRFFSILFQQIRRVITFVPSHHIYGFLFTVILPKILNVNIFDARHLSIGKLTQSLNDYDLIVSIPVQWTYFNNSLSSQFTISASNIQGLTSTAPCQPQLIQALRKKGIQPITEIFGASETSGVGYRQSPLSPYRLLPYLSRTKDDPDQLEKQLPSGEVRLMDIVDTFNWVDDRRFHPLKRKDGCVQIGGINVNPSFVAEKINDHPDVSTCAVRMMNPNEGNRLKAFIVPKDMDKQSQIRQWIRQNLPSVERPAAIVFGEVLPRNEMGKLQDFESFPYDS